MGIMDTVKYKFQSWLEITPAAPTAVNLMESLDFEGNAIKNRIWYRGEASEIEQLYYQIPTYHSDARKFWASHPTPGMECRKIHTGLPAVMVDLLAGIISASINDIKVEGTDVWDKIAAENSIKKLVEKSVRETLVIGDGAFKISVDSEISEYPILEYWPGDRVEFRTKRGRVQEVIFKSTHKIGSTKYTLKEVYGRGYIDYELYQNDEPVEMIPEFAGLVRTEWDGNDMLAVPCMFYASSRWEHRGRSIYDKKIDAFDSFDEAYSQWIDALRAGRTKEYIPENLLPRNPHTGKPLKPNSFDNRYIQTDADLREKANSQITTQSAEIQYESYAATYATALDLCLQGIMSPSTLGIDVKKLDNADAQREKEKVTLYTRDTIIEALQPILEDLVKAAIKTYQRFTGQAETDPTVTVSFQDYANPSFESQIETVAKGRTAGIMSIEACVDELYGDDKDESWKAEEVARLKEEQGFVELEEPAIKEDIL